MRRRSILRLSACDIVDEVLTQGVWIMHVHCLRGQELVETLPSIRLVSCDMAASPHPQGGNECANYSHSLFTVYITHTVG